MISYISEYFNTIFGDKLRFVTLVAAENDGRTTRAKVRSSKTYQTCTQKPDEETKPSTATTSFAVIQPNNSKAKTDNYSDGPWGEWISHFKLCAEINNWNDAQCCQQLVVSL